MRGKERGGMKEGRKEREKLLEGERNGWKEKMREDGKEAR